MRRRWFWLLAFVAFATMLAVYRWQQSLRVERTVIAQIPPDFSEWIATDLDGDGNAEVLLTYHNRPPLLLRLSANQPSQQKVFTSPQEATTVSLPNVAPVTPSTSETRKASLPLVRAVPVKTRGGFRLMRWRNARIVFEPLPKVNKPTHVVWQDADGDGKANDLIVRSGQKRFWFMLNEMGEWRFKAPLPSGPIRPLIGVGDIDGDGKPEFVAGGKTYSVLWGDGKPETVLGKFNAELERLQLADMDGDGQKEIVAFKREGGNYRLAVWAFDDKRKGLAVTALSAPFPISLPLSIGSGARPWMVWSRHCDALWAHDWDGDKRKELAAAWGSGDFPEWDWVVELQRQVTQLHRQIQPPFRRQHVPAPIVLLAPKPLPSSQPQVWRLFWQEGEGLRTQEVKLPKDWKGKLPPVASLTLNGQRFFIMAHHKSLRRFRPRLLSFNPLQLEWWEMGSVWQGTIWKLPEGKDALNPTKWAKVAELPGKPLLVTDLNGDGQQEILWDGTEVWHPFDWRHQRMRYRLGIASFNGKRWRQIAWRYPSTKTGIDRSGAQVVLLIAVPDPHLRFLLFPEGNRKTLLIALPDGTIEWVRMG